MTVLAPGRRRDAVVARCERFIAMRREGLTNVEISEREGEISPSSVSDVFRRATEYGLDPPPPPYWSRGTDPMRAARDRESQKRYQKERRDWLDAYKRERGCVDCGTMEGHLDFDHRLGEVKLFNLGRPRASWEKIKAEVAKCDVRCRSCHSKRHWQEVESLSPEQHRAIVERDQGDNRDSLAQEFSVSRAAVDRTVRRYGPQSRNDLRVENQGLKRVVREVLEGERVS